MACGIYQILNCVNGKSYIGQSQDIERRIKEHKYQLGSAKHHCKHLQNSWNKYKEDNFIFRIVDECPVEELDLLEQKYLDIVFENATQYNDCRFASSCRGVKRSAETREKIRIAHIGKQHPDETKSKIAASGRVAQNRPEVLDKRIGKKFSEAHKAKLSLANSGENSPSAKLCADDVKEIRALLTVSTLLQRDIAMDYRISEMQVSRIKRWLTWKEVEAA